MKDVPAPVQGNSPGSTVTPPSLEPDAPRQVIPEPSSEVRYTGFELWLHRVTMLLLVFVCAVVGVLLVIMPWRPEWTDNHLLTAFPGLRAFVASGFVRGICSGLGLLDIWIGFWEAIHYHELKHP